MSVVTGRYEHCPKCGNDNLMTNEFGVQQCRACYWVSEDPAEPKKHLAVGIISTAEAITSSQKYIVGLRRAFGYKSNREIYRLRKQLGNINIVKATHSEGPLTNGSHEVIVVTYQPAGGLRRFPLVQHTVEVETNARLQEIQLSGLHPHMRGPVSDKLSGQAVFAKCYIKDSADPQASA